MSDMSRTVGPSTPSLEEAVLRLARPANSAALRLVLIWGMLAWRDWGPKVVQARDNVDPALSHAGPCLHDECGVGGTEANCLNLPVRPWGETRTRRLGKEDRRQTLSHLGRMRVASLRPQE